MKKRVFRYETVAVIALACCVFLAAPALSAEAGASHSYPLLSLTRHMGLAGMADPGTRVIVWDDGVVHIHHPSFLKGAGDYRLVLGEAELASLLADLVGDGLLEFDADDARDAIARERQAAKLPGVVSGEMDRGFTALDYRFQLDEGGTLVEGRVRWTGLQSSARRFPDVEVLAGMARIERRILELADDPRIERLSAAGQP